MDKLYGSVITKQNINGSVVLKESIQGVLSLPYSMNRYTGKYEVTPTIEGEVLETANKMMVDDVTIHAIPYQEVPNIQGGKTVTIAFE